MIKNVLFGILFILFGIIIGLNSFGITNIDLFFEGWWTLFIIIPCLIDLFNKKDKTGSIIGLVISGLLLLSAQGIMDFDILFKLLLPIILVIIGLSIIFKNFNKNELIPEVKNTEEYCATFTGLNLNFVKEEFKGCNMEAIFGGIKCNLDDAKIIDKSVINATSLFGGINILVPDNIKLVVKSTSIFGGLSNKHINGDGKKTLYINATCLFGGVVINDKNTKDN